jgi:L-alanine-DL-glutamate epimerase-like enolase superfamily enzyme
VARIRAVRSSVLSIPLHTPFVTALRRTSTIDTLIVCLDLADGTTGLGEAPQVWAVTGDSVASATACVEQVLAPVLVGADSDDWDALAAGVARACARNFGAKAAVETALLDAVARAAGMPLAHLFADVAGVPRPVSRGVGLGGGAAGVFEVATDVTISAGSPEALRSAAQARVAEGFHPPQTQGRHRRRD